jgi:hypothetical protein
VRDRVRAAFCAATSVPIIAAAVSGEARERESDVALSYAIMFPM